MHAINGDTLLSWFSLDGRGHDRQESVFWSKAMANKSEMDSLTGVA